MATVIDTLKEAAQALADSSASFKLISDSVIQINTAARDGFAAVAAKLQELKDQIAKGVATTEDVVEVQQDVTDAQASLVASQQNLVDSLTKAQEVVDAEAEAVA